MAMYTVPGVATAPSKMINIGDPGFYKEGKMPEITTPDGEKTINIGDPSFYIHADVPFYKIAEIKNPSNPIINPDNFLTTPKCISDYALPEAKWGGKYYSEEEVDAAQDKYANLTKEEQEEMKKIYEKGIDEFNKMKTMEATRIGINLPETSMDEFLAENPEFKEAFETMGPIAQDYNNHLTEAANEYLENAPWYEKAALKMGFKTPGMNAAMEIAKIQYQCAYQLEKFDGNLEQAIADPELQEKIKNTIAELGKEIDVTPLTEEELEELKKQWTLS